MSHFMFSSSTNVERTQKKILADIELIYKALSNPESVRNYLQTSLIPPRVRRIISDYLAGSIDEAIAKQRLEEAREMYRKIMGVSGMGLDENKQALTFFNILNFFIMR